jgi:phosphatidylserine/phosphatidylglycerophosphate/cardiolipin synthase-like enzyme
MLVDPLTNDPTLITGSANFSNASTKNNDENMLIIQGNERVADIYLGEFIRLFNHFYFRYIASLYKSRESTVRKAAYLAPNDEWTERYFTEGRAQEKERRLFG